VGADPEHDPAADPLLQCAPAFAFDQRLSRQPPPSPSLRTRVRRKAGSCLPPPTCPHAATFASVPARKSDDKRA
jgi:hypothetical protein